MRQKKTGGPVRLELTKQTRQTINDYIKATGKKWTLLVVREVLAGSRRFNDFRRGIPHISPTLLSRRLKTLEVDGLIKRRPI